MFGWNVAQWIEGLSSVDKALGSIPGPAYDQDSDSAYPNTTEVKAGEYKALIHPKSASTQQVQGWPGVMWDYRSIDD